MHIPISLIILSSANAGLEFFFWIEKPVTLSTPLGFEKNTSNSLVLLNMVYQYLFEQSLCHPNHINDIPMLGIA